LTFFLSYPAEKPHKIKIKPAPFLAIFSGVWVGVGTEFEVLQFLKQGASVSEAVVLQF